MVGHWSVTEKNPEAVIVHQTSAMYRVYSMSDSSDSVIVVSKGYESEETANLTPRSSVDVGKCLGITIKRNNGDANGTYNIISE